ncbi:hypothetical protein BDQ17DRAFT_1208239, partial [Cyathus striatus]
IPDVKWTKDDKKLIWALLTELEKPKNHPLFFGKTKILLQNTSADTKMKVCKHIAAAILPAGYAKNPKVMGNRVKMKIDGLFTLYKTHEKCLWLTGEG